jgi:tetratricopeptide (TPR) repeat protein
MAGLTTSVFSHKTSLKIAFSLLLLFLIGPRIFAQDSLPASVETQMAAGIQALKRGDLDAAQNIFSEAVRRGVKHPLIFHNLGVIAQQRGNHQQAIAEFRKAILLQPEYGPTRLLLGSSLLATGQKAEAERELKHSVRLMPEQPIAHLQLAKAYEASDNWIAAVKELRKLVEMAPQDAEYSYQLGKAWSRLSGWSYQQMARLNSNSARLHQALGQQYLIQEKYDLAMRAYQQAAQSDPKLPEIHLGMALISLELKKFDEALTEINLELKLVPESKAAAEAKTKIEAAKASAAP